LADNSTRSKHTPAAFWDCLDWRLRQRETLEYTANSSSVIGLESGGWAHCGECLGRFKSRVAYWPVAYSKTRLASTPFFCHKAKRTACLSFLSAIGLRREARMIRIDPETMKHTANKAGDCAWDDARANKRN